MLESMKKKILKSRKELSAEWHEMVLEATILAIILLQYVETFSQNLEMRLIVRRVQKDLAL